MTIEYFARMLSPDVDVVVYRTDVEGERLPVCKFKAKDAGESKYSHETIKDWKACISRPMFRVDI